MPPKSEFTKQVADAYEHLYDLVYLRTHPLADALVRDPDIPRKEKAWRFHRLLLQAIDELNPGPQAPTYSHEWRRHRFMVLRYVDALDPAAVAGRLAISRRQYYREYDAAMEAVATVLWERHVAPPLPEPPATPRQETPAGRLELLRLEAARMAQTHRYTFVGDEVPGVLTLLQERLEQHRLEAEWQPPDRLPGVALDRSLLRQMLLAMLGYLAERAGGATIRIAAADEETALRLSLRVDPATAARAASAAELQEQASALSDLAALSGARIVPIGEAAIVGFDVRLPVAPQRTVLVVDDNEDVLELFQRYLGLHRYRVATARTAAEALALARRLQPQAITLDVMIPEQDGWEILQALLTRPDTRHIPVIVCSVLRQKDLALSLGAVAFLEKPVTEEALLAALQALGET